MSQKFEFDTSPAKFSFTPAKERRQAAGDLKRVTLLDEAAKIFNQRGVSQSSLAIIAKNVGVSRSALYYYVDNQQDLLYECYVRTCEQLIGLLNAAHSKCGHSVDLISEFVGSALDENRPEFASLSEVAFLNEEQRNVILGLYNGIRATLADIISKGVGENELRQCQPRIVASIIIGLVSWVPVATRWPKSSDLPKSLLKSAIQQIARIGIENERFEPKAYGRFDFTPVITVSGNKPESGGRGAAKREKILARASWLFNQKGIDATSLDEIANQIGMTKKVIYHNIGGKDDLVTECHRRAFRFFEFGIEKMQAMQEGRLDALCTGLASLAEASLRPEIAPFGAMTGHNAWRDDVREELRSKASRLRKSHIRMQRQGIDEGTIRPLKPEMVSFLFPGFYEWMPRWRELLSPSERENAPDEVANFLRLGLSAL